MSNNFLLTIMDIFASLYHEVFPSNSAACFTIFQIVTILNQHIFTGPASNIISNTVNNIVEFISCILKPFGSFH